MFPLLSTVNKNRVIYEEVLTMKRITKKKDNRDLFSTIMDYNYSIIFRSHTVGMEDMSIADETVRAIYREAYEATEEEVELKRLKLYRLLQQRAQ